MEGMAMNMDEYKPATPQNIMQVYRNATLEVDKASDYDTKIAAYGKVINFCSSTLSCRLDRSVKKNMLLYWAYNNVAEAYINKHEVNKAVQNFRRALQLARSNREKSAVLEKLARVYQQADDFSNWIKVSEKLIEYLEPDRQRSGYLQLAEQTKDENKVIGLLEKAVQAVSREDSGVVEKCTNVLDLCAKLQELYDKRKDKINGARIRDLREKTSQLLRRAVQ